MGGVYDGELWGGVPLQIHNGVSAQMKRAAVISASINCAGFLYTAALP